MSRLATERAFFAEHPGGVFDEAWHDMQMRYAVEPYQEALAEVRDLLEEHWREVALDHDAIKLEPDYERYAAIDADGKLHLCTARIGGELVGYHLSIVHSHLHYKSSLTCFTDVFFLRKEYRNGLAGYKLLKFFRDSVRKRFKVQKIYMSMKLTHEIGPLLERLGFKPIERVYTAVFNE